ncbi:MAG: YdcF family protein [Pseudomonadota bacterium]
MQRLVAGIILLGLGWLGGFVWFVASMPGGASAPKAGADAVIVLTGAGGDRMPTGMALIEQGVGRRLLISGVNPDVSREEIAGLWPGERDEFDCCVDLGKRAETTNGNAVEAAAWISAHGFDEIVLVTSDYHMRRAMLEMRAARPGAAFIAHPVASVFLDTEGRPASPEAWRVLAIEYSKYLAVRLKTLLPA